MKTLWTSVVVFALTGCQAPSNTPVSPGVATVAQSAPDGGGTQSETSGLSSCDETASPFGGGDGSTATPFLICSVAQLEETDSPSNQSLNFLLTADLDITAHVKPGAFLGYMGGVFDGGNHTISGFGNTSESATIVGLFGEVNGTVKNLTLNHVTPYGATLIGAVAGELLAGGVIDHVTVSGFVGLGDSSQTEIGGIAGSMKGGTISNSSVNVTVVGLSSIGGITGTFSGGTISGVTVNGSVNGNFNVGGGIGFNDIKISDGGIGSGLIEGVEIHATYSGSCMNGYLSTTPPTFSGNSC